MLVFLTLFIFHACTARIDRANVVIPILYMSIVVVFRERECVYPKICFVFILYNKLIVANHTNSTRNAERRRQALEKTRLQRRDKYRYQARYPSRHNSALYRAREIREFAFT